LTVPLAGLSELLATHREAIVRYIRGIVRDGAEAEDLTQETLLRAYNKLSTLEDPSRLVPWLYRIATNVTHDRFRQASYRHRPVSLDEDRGAAGEPALREIVFNDSPHLDKLMEQKEMSSCAQAGNGPECPCKKRVCLPIVGLVGIAVVVSLAAKRRNRK